MPAIIWTAQQNKLRTRIVHGFCPKFLIYHKKNYFRVATDEACSTFNAMMLEFGYLQKLEIYDPQTHRIHPSQQHPFY